MHKAVLPLGAHYSLLGQRKNNKTPQSIQVMNQHGYSFQTLKNKNSKIGID